MTIAHPHRRACAFTLLEVIVAMAIAAVATIVLIPALIQLRSSAGDITCQNNLRQLGSALEMYNVDNNGRMPYGFYYVNSDPVTWQPVGGNTEYISWASELNKYFNPTQGYAPAFQCPQAQQQAGPHPVSYVMNMIVAVSPLNELQVGMPPRAQTKPASIHLMLNDRPPGTALMWDTAIHPEPPRPEGYLIGYDIDGQKFWSGANVPQRRYFSPRDVYAQIPPGVFGQDRPVGLNVGGNVYRNIDPPPGSGFPYQGNLRFRHDDQTRCNALFTDGSVGQFTAVVNKDLRVASHDALRRFFMIHYPAGVSPNPAHPH